MPHFKAPDGTLHYLDAGVEPTSVIGFPVGASQISESEVESLRAVPSSIDVIRTQIAALEARQTPRRIREAVFGNDNGWLASIDQQIADLRAQL